MRRLLLVLPVVGLALTACGSGTDMVGTLAPPASPTAPAATGADGSAATDGTASSPLQGPGYTEGVAIYPETQQINNAQCPTKTVQAAHLPTPPPRVEEAYVCYTEARRVQGDGQWLYDVTWKVTGGLDALLSSWATPDATPGPGDAQIACTDIGYLPSIVWLHGDRVIAVRPPTTICGAPMDAAVKAYNNLTKTVYAERKVRQVQSELVMSTGCSDQWKLVFSGEYSLHSGTRVDAPAPQLPDGTPMGCVYRADDDGAGRLERGVDFSISAVNAALIGSKVDPTCNQTTTREWAHLAVEGKGGALDIALDGCAVQDESGNLWRGADQLRALLR